MLSLVEHYEYLAILWERCHSVFCNFDFLLYHGQHAEFRQTLEDLSTYFLFGRFQETELGHESFQNPEKCFWASTHF